MASQRSQVQTPFVKSVEDLTEIELKREEKELSNSIRKLQESNEEMQQFDPQGKDGILVEAITENKDVIARRAQRLEAVRKRLVDIHGLAL
mmetsp:Transcript_2968/g.9086  ORF Transcript_2968/g.9086 Transcript_2968/m.9086 type:complete len:91 (+) Transcript_2968:134-406(+)